MLREARARTGLTQSEFAARARTSQSALSAYERGKRQPTLAVLRRCLEVAKSRLVLGSSPADSKSPSPPPDRGIDLLRVLDLAAEFPAHHAPTLDYPRFDAP